MASAKGIGREARQRQHKVAREERLRDRQRRQSTQRRRNLAISIGLTLLVLVVGGLLGWSGLKPKPGVQIPSQGRDHIRPGESHPSYDSNPPTSGWHYDQPARPGIYRVTVPDEVSIHNLEHGCIWISYREPGDTGLVARLEGLAARYPLTVLLTPRPHNDSAIAVVAWQRLLKLEKYDETRILEFIKAFTNRGPEPLECSGAMTR